jgi:hypothetical protein
VYIYLIHGQLKIGGGKKRVLLDWREKEEV